MPLIKKLQTAFVAGTIAKQAWGRVDKPFYGVGADKLENVYTNPIGGIKKREGLRLIQEAPKDSGDSLKPRLAKFVFNKGQSYLIAFYKKMLSIYKNDALVKTWTDTSGMPSLAEFTDSILAEMKIIQSVDTLILTHADLEPLQLKRLSDTDWRLEPITFTDVPYHAFNSVTVTPGASNVVLSGLTSLTVTATTTVDMFSSASVGQVITYKLGGLLRITKFLSTKEVEGVLEQDFYNPSTGTTLTIPMNDWTYDTGYERSWSSTRGYPTCCCFYQRRLWLGGTKSRPTTLFWSEVDDYFTFKITDRDDSAGELTLVDNELNEIVNLFPGRNLQIYTIGDEHYIPQDPSTPITPSNIKVKRSTSHGSSLVTPVSVDGVTIFVERFGKVVREYVYEEAEQSYNANAISFLASNNILNPVYMDVKKANTDTPADYVFIVNGSTPETIPLKVDGAIAVLNMWRSQELLAWSLFTTRGKFRDVVTVDKDVYVVVEREVTGYRTVFTIEKFDEARILDCSVYSNYQPQATTHFPKSSFDTNHRAIFDELEIQVRSAQPYVFELADVKLDAVGDINVSLSYPQIEIGFGFDVVAKILPVDADLGYKTITADRKRLCQVLVKTYNTTGFNVVIGDSIVYTSSKLFKSYSLGTPLPEVSEWVQVDTGGGIYRDLQMELSYNSPIKFEIVSVVLQVAI